MRSALRITLFIYKSLCKSTSTIKISSCKRHLVSFAQSRPGAGVSIVYQVANIAPKPFKQLNLDNCDTQVFIGNFIKSRVYVCWVLMWWNVVSLSWYLVVIEIGFAPQKLHFVLLIYKKMVCDRKGNVTVKQIDFKCLRY